MLNGRLLTCSVGLSLAATVVGMPTGGRGTNARFSPDGTSVAFQDENGGRRSVRVMELSDGTAKWIDPGPGIAAQPAFGAGGRIAYGYMHDGKTAVEAEKSGSQDGFGLRLWERGAVRDLTHGRWRDYTPSFSADGKSVYFATTRDQAQSGFLQRGASIWKLTLADGSTECVVPVNAYNAGAIEPAESPDGRFLAWAQMNGFRDIWHVVMARKDGLGRIFELTPPTMPAHAPAWSPDGRHLAFAACGPDDPGWCVYVVNLVEGTWCNTGLGRNPSFSPDGKTLVCDDGRNWSVRPFPAQEAFSPMPEERKTIGDAVFSADVPPVGNSTLPLPKEAAFGDGDFWVELDVDCDPGAKGVKVGVDGAYESHRSVFQLYCNTATKWPGATFTVRTAAGEWFGTGPAPVCGKGRHRLTGIKRCGYIALYVDGHEKVRRPVLNGVCPANGPLNAAFRAENGKIVRFSCGPGWPASLQPPSRNVFFGQEVRP